MPCGEAFDSNVYEKAVANSNSQRIRRLAKQQSSTFVPLFHPNTYNCLNRQHVFRSTGLM